MSRDELKEVLEAILVELKAIRLNTAPTIHWPYPELPEEPVEPPPPFPGPVIVYGVGE
jgi:hypothetical protein